MTTKTEVSRETTTTKPNRSDSILLGVSAEKDTAQKGPETPIYADLMEYISARNELKSRRQEIDDLLTEVEDEINRCLDEIEANNIKDSRYVVSGVSTRTRRTINPQWFKENEPELFYKLATVDGKTALRLIADAEGGQDAARRYLREINPDVYDAHASFTIQDIIKTMGANAVSEFEFRGAYHIDSKRVGDAQLVPINPGVE